MTGNENADEPVIGERVTGNARGGIRWPITGKLMAYATEDGGGQPLPVRLAAVLQDNGRQYWVEAATVRRGNA